MSYFKQLYNIISYLIEKVNKEHYNCHTNISLKKGMIKMKQSKSLVFSMIAGAAIGATASMLAIKSKPKKCMTKTAGNAIKAVGNFVEHMNF